MTGARTKFGALGDSGDAWRLCARSFDEKKTETEGRTP
jgi:hypothetical protein